MSATRRTAVVMWVAAMAVPAYHAPAHPQRSDVFEARVAQLRAELGAPGAVVGIRLPDDRTEIVAAGLADREHGVAMTPATPYFFGSISKTFTAVVALRLAEEGLLAASEPVSRYVPEVPRGDEITLDHLLRHTSGLRDFYLYLYFRPDRDEMIDLVTRDWSRSEVLELVQRFGFDFEPGTAWAYSNTNYYLLGIVIEAATGGSLAEAYDRYIYRPVGLDSTWLGWHEPEKAAPVSVGYLGPVAGWEHSAMFGDLGPTTVLDRSPIEWGAGGVVGPAADALAFMTALTAGHLVAPETLARMGDFQDTPRLGVSEGDESLGSDGYGQGLVRMERPGATWIGHGGLFTGHTAGLWHRPVCDLTVAFYFNRGFVGQRRALDSILETVRAVFPEAGC